jgi:hypothetical protein
MSILTKKIKADVIGIDGDILLYQIGFATQCTTWRCVPVGALEGDPVYCTTSKKAMNSFLEEVDVDVLLESELHVRSSVYGNAMIDAIIARYQTIFDTDNVEIYLTGEGNFREAIATIQPYKGNRIAEKPKNYGALKDYLLSKECTRLVNGEEADDALSMGMMRTDVMYVAITEDKDLKNTPGWLYNPRKDSLIKTSPEDAILNFYKQLLTGDSTDNIKGVPGMGSVAAEKAYMGLSSAREYYLAALAAYAKEYPEEPREALLENGRLLWMRRKAGELWTPEDYF